MVVARKTVSEHECFLSLASMWEMAKQMAANGFSQLEIGFRHAVRCASLDWRHRAPFDRLLIAQALDEDLPIVSRDILLEPYVSGESGKRIRSEESMPPAPTRLCRHRRVGAVGDPLGPAASGDGILKYKTRYRIES
jgi:hypothetical protein